MSILREVDFQARHDDLFRLCREKQITTSSALASLDDLNEDAEAEEVLYKADKDVFLRDLLVAWGSVPEPSGDEDEEEADSDDDYSSDD